MPDSTVLVAGHMHQFTKDEDKLILQHALAHGLWPAPSHDTSITALDDVRSVGAVSVWQALAAHAAIGEQRRRADVLCVRYCRLRYRLQRAKQ